MEPLAPAPPPPPPGAFPAPRAALSSGTSSPPTILSGPRCCCCRCRRLRPRRKLVSPSPLALVFARLASRACRVTIARYILACARCRRAGSVSCRKFQRRRWARFAAYGPKRMRKTRESRPLLVPVVAVSSRARLGKRRGGAGKGRCGTGGHSHLAGTGGGVGDAGRRQRLRENGFGARIFGGTIWIADRECVLILVSRNCEHNQSRDCTESCFFMAARNQGR
ncbi:uncharacterized protein BJX67DRAFT_347901 [Aspergillus lucknowensis]|uniref:Uncharacterized protein n=1 Tax=Aspergillus lucknowensis TaxID=176173 RepID=A0ABR4LXK2_9EURO